MRTKKHLLTAAFVTAASTIATTIPCIASCAYKNGRITPAIKTININLPSTDFSVNEYHTTTTDPIIVECFDEHGKEVKGEIEWVITSDDGVSQPEWIKVNESNQLVITALKEKARYGFTIFAQDTKTKLVKSECKTFYVDIVAAPLVPPDSIEVLNVSQKKFIYMRQSDSIRITARGHREGFQPEEVSSECTWELTQQAGKRSKDLTGAPTLYIQADKDGCNLFMSKYIDDNWAGNYAAMIVARSVESKEVTGYIILQFEACNGTTYVHSESGCILTRKDLNDSWTITSLVADTTIISGLPEQIMDHPITKVGKNLCSVSGITELTEVYLPKSVIEIEESAFINQMKLTTIAMPGVKYVGDSAFRGCNQLTLSQEYDQPILRYVGARAFYLCTRLSLSSKNELYYIGERAFCSSGITDIDIGPYISFIDTDAFTDCLYLENIIISNLTPPKLGGILFYGSSNPQSIKVPLDAVMTYINDDNWAPYSPLIVGF